jgi:putative ABC transport system permease protein
MWHEMIAASRRLQKDPWSAGSAVIALSLGIGLTTLVFAVGYGIVLRPLPYRSPARLIMIAATAPASQIATWRDHLGSFMRIAGYARGNLTVRGLGDPRPTPSAVVSDGFFQVLDMPALRGRVFKDRRDTGAAVVSERFARREGSLDGVLGRSIVVGTASVTIVGVMPGGFAFPDDGTDVWIAAAAVPAIPLGDVADERRFQLFGRLNDGVTIDVARGAVSRARAVIDPKGRPPAGPDAVSFREMATASIRPALLALAGSAVLVLLIACANVATIMIARTIQRQRELAIRIAVGATRWRVFATTLAESAVVSAVGTAGGAALAAVAIRLVPVVAGNAITRVHDVRVDWVVLLFAAVVASVAAASAAAPALRIPIPDPSNFRDQGRTRRGARLRAILTVAQIAVSLVLLIAAGLLGRTVTTLLGRDIGIDARRTLVSQVLLTDAMSFDAHAQAARLRNVLDRVRGVGGVTAAGAGSSVPPNNGSLVMTLRVVTGSSEKTTPEVTFSAVTPGYLEAIGARLRRGRLFEASDEQRTVLSVVLSESAARTLSPGRDPTGTSLDFDLPGLRQRGHPAVIGIVGDVAYEGLEFSPGPAIYILWRELPASHLFLAVRSSGDPRAVAPAVTMALREADSGLPVMPIRSMDAAVTRSISERALRALIGGGAAGIALAIAAVGLAGGLSRTVAERRRELAIRAALGATPSTSVGLVLREVAGIVGVGTAVGLAAGVAGARLLRSAVYPVSPYDPVVLAGVTALVIVLSIGVCAVPARRAATVDPMDALRS